MHTYARSMSAAACCLAVALTAGCGSSPESESESAPTPAEATPAPQYELTGVPGTVLASEDFGDRSTELSDTGTTLYRLVYESTSGVDGSPTAVSGVAAVPAGSPPEGGWPIVVYGHGTTGVQAGCGPSLSSYLLGYHYVVKDFAELGYVTVLPDYQGLGTGGGTHPYLEPRTAGYNMIDAARATHAALPDTSTRWAAAGLSQGGQAAWAANELDSAYGQGMELVGSASLSPPTDLTPLVRAATDGTLTTPQKELLPYLLYGAQQVDPSIDPNAYSGSVAQDNNELLLSCDSGDTEARKQVVEEMAPDEFAADSTESEQKLIDVIGRFTLPQVRTEVPMYVAYGGQDDVILPQWTADGVEKACALGDSVVVDEQADSGHDVSDEAAIQFIADRFAGQPVTSTC
ncbi:lipase [Rhodococcus ruber]|uniref:Lipase n=1 Tax=Rhodococcus ruber TaxID=1830 RepID=A0ABT4MEH4_9NOCA|nr:lipase family protein [Rhodococcus ruber]MCZ4518146.1 lipase [Rhodococcus ruber]